MRHFLPLLAVLAVLSTKAHAVDDPALPDGGSLIIVADGGVGAIVDLTRTGSWNMSLSCDPVCHYKMCESNSTACAPTRGNRQLDRAGVVYDIGVPSNRRYLGLLFVGAASSDGGQPEANVQSVTP